MTSIADLPDPRTWPDAGAAGDLGALYAIVRQAIDAPTGREADARDAEARRRLSQIVAAGGQTLEHAMARAPSLDVARHLWRTLATIERAGEASLHTTLAAIPVVVVAALDGTRESQRLPGVVPDAQALAVPLREAREFAGCEVFSLANALADADAIGVRALPRLLASRALAGEPQSHLAPPLDLPPAPIDVEPGNERVHLRFIAAAVLTPPGVDPLAAPVIGRWGMRFAQLLAEQLAQPGVSLLALPRPPQSLVGAVQTGRAAQREISAQLFASNAIRTLRASFGEPTASISAHRAADATGGGELRLSLSAPFKSTGGDGFRCPLYPYEAVQDVAAMLVGLLRDCRVPDIRLLPEVHPDIDPVTGGPLFFKP